MTERILTREEAQQVLGVLEYCRPYLLYMRPREDAITTLKARLAEPEQQQRSIPTVYLYRQPDGNTHVMAPNINDPVLVIDMLEEGIRAMTKGRPITRN